MFKTEIYLHTHNKQGLCYSASGDYSIQMSHGSASGVCCLYWFSFMISCLPVCLVIFSNEHRSWKKKKTFSNNLKLRMTFVFLQKTSICFWQELRGTDNLGSIWSNFRGWSLETPPDNLKPGWNPCKRQFMSVHSHSWGAAFWCPIHNLDVPWDSSLLVSLDSSFDPPCTVRLLKALLSLSATCSGLVNTPHKAKVIPNKIMFLDFCLLPGLGSLIFYSLVSS